MSKRAHLLTATASAMLLAASMLVVTGCAGQSCAGQCGPPFQMQVVFRPGTTTQAAASAMTPCAANPQVVRIGHVHRFHGASGAEPPGSLTATVYTRSLFPRTRTGRQQQGHLFACLRQSPTVTSAGFPD